jgi:SAM-dependent methyltransferase
MVSDLSRKPFAASRVLDLASLTGDFAVECALRGAEVLGIEGRSSNLDRAIQRVSLPNLRFVQDDVRNLSRDKYGEFDVVLCLGILYHLDEPDCFKLLESMAAVCTGLAIIDTHVGLTREERVEYNGHEYRGWRYTEYPHPPTSEEIEANTWGSLGNPRSFWLTRPSLVNAIVDAGFNSVYECQFPAWNDISADRVALAALKGTREPILAEQGDDRIFNERVDEVPRLVSLFQSDH